MMNQEQFLKALQERIAMLEQAEQQDILAEYAQHIEMQIKDGFSEEEAIRDFGSLDELAAEILEAYHIDPAYHTSAQELEKAEILEDAVKKPGLWERFVTKWHSFTRKVKDWFHRERKPKKERTSVTSDARTKYSQAGQGIRRFWMRFWEVFKRACKTALWLCWNGVLLVSAIPLALLIVCGVICFGFLVVLLFQGYSMIGVSLAIVGGLMVCVAVLCLGWGLVWHRARPTVYQVEQEPVQESMTEVVEQIHQSVCAVEPVEHGEEQEADHE